jgi:hypothetical protein
MLAAPALADVQFTAQVDRTQISLDDSVSLKLAVRIEGGIMVGPPEFDAPDFEVVNQYEGTFIESYYENGRFGMRNNRTLTKVMRPLKVGTLTISKIRMVAGGRTYTAPPIHVQVGPSGAGTPPPRNYGGGGVGGLRGAGKRVSGPGFFVRAEVDKQKLHKGEQLVVSYYLYRRVRVFNIQVDKYPILSGFLREDLEMPVLGQRLDSENVVLDGVGYERALLVRYAAYPLKEGKLSIDPMAIKVNYYGASTQQDEDDPFATFFQSLAPRVGTGRSEVLTVEVEPLPMAGRPSSFTGGVGDFNVTSAVDRYDVRANEAVTLTVKVEGRGNASSIEEPKAKWPDNVELYEAKGTAKSGEAGVGEKVFEFLLIPRAEGKVTLPSLEFAFFDPTRKEYVTRKTEPIDINVTPGAPGSQVVRPRAQVTPGAQTSKDPTEPRGLLPPEGDGAGAVTRVRRPLWDWLYWLGALGFVLFAGFVVFDKMRRKQARAGEMREANLLAESKSWQKLRASARRAAEEGSPWKDVSEAYERLMGAVYDSIDRCYDIGARSLSRRELARILVDERGLPEPVWTKAMALLEFGELVRFASSTGAVTESQARSQLAKWVADGQAVEEGMLRHVSRRGGK